MENLQPLSSLPCKVLQSFTLQRKEFPDNLYLSILCFFASFSLHFIERTCHWRRHSLLLLLITDNHILHLAFLVNPWFRLLLEESSSILSVDCKSWTPVDTPKHPFVLPRYSSVGSSLLYDFLSGNSAIRSRASLGKQKMPNIGERVSRRFLIKKYGVLVRVVVGVAASQETFCLIHLK